MIEAKFIEKQNSELKCVLCPHNCVIKHSKKGICNVRINQNNKIYSTVYNNISALHVDPIEKKPLYHFYPGKQILSVGGVGCNLKCKFCQNWEISQNSCEDYSFLKKLTSDDIVNLALETPNNIGVAYTYNEPTVWYEFMIEIAQKIKAKNLKNIMVTNAFINKKPLQELLPFIDAFSIDLKAFNENFYKRTTLSKLQPVKDAIEIISNSDSFLEITNLIIPGFNDNKKEFTEMVKWISSINGKNTVLHISRYFPNYKMNIKETPQITLTEFYNIAKLYLNHVYLGNTFSVKEKNTYCPECNSIVIERFANQVKYSGLDNTGNCISCHNKIIKNI